MGLKYQKSKIYELSMFFFKTCIFDQFNYHKFDVLEMVKDYESFIIWSYKQQ